MNTDSNIKQFYIDVPRMNVYLDGNLSENGPEYVENYIKEKFDEKLFDTIIFILTQTFIAKFYIEEFKKVEKNDEHLFDGGNLITKLDSEEKTITVEKKFKSVVILEELVYVSNFCTLNVYVNLENKNVIYSWNYELSSENDLTVINSRTDSYYLI